MEKKPRKSPSYVVQARVQEVKDYLLLGYTRSEVIIQFTTKFKVEPRMVDEYIAKARAQINEVNAKSTEDTIATIEANQWILYRAAIATKDLKLARQILMDVAKLKGLDQSTINHIVDDKRDLANISDDELESILGSNPNARH